MLCPDCRQSLHSVASIACTWPETLKISQELAQGTDPATLLRASHCLRGSSTSQGFLGQRMCRSRSMPPQRGRQSFLTAFMRLVMQVT